MCGILCAINCDGISKSTELKNILLRRGPDFSSSVAVNYDNVQMEFACSVLWQQGLSVCSQPFETGNFLILFNGDIFNIPGELSSCSDTEWLGNEISKCRCESDICSTIQSLEGPFSLIIYNKSSGILYVCRDALGRNSLIMEAEDSKFRFLSTSYNFNANGDDVPAIMELPPLGLYAFNVILPTEWKLFPWRETADTMLNEIKKFNEIFRINVYVENYLQPKWLCNYLETTRSFNFYEMCKNLETTCDNLFEILLENKYVLEELQRFSLLLEESVKNRVRHTPPRCVNCLNQQGTCNHAKIAILFSGGIDCSILAALSNKYVDDHDSIDLINVAFERLSPGLETSWDVPDRLSAKNSFAELKKLYPQRNWNYVEVNISRQELCDNLQSHIKHLIYPLNTVLDESIGAAFWFASRGKGICLGKEYLSPARVVIVGSGADELFGGYKRHRNAFWRFKGTDTEKLENLHKELDKDWNRIWARNLGRDDRVVADNSKTLRAPFIEEHLVQYVRSLSPSQICCFLLKEGVGDKLFLRLYGFQLGLRNIAYEKKRAIQFGSKIANKKQNATDRSIYL
ncbi:asparagine synthetase domain-containing protein CG17486 [Bactrocera tryoni]|uniref:asparagine synthetase domain-containing protein CG17486 n=1 Tax=Bactrocera tryoni TaxID=59916 RepID=UPI001A997209|nr:asparagine synthetase domain-containing protein CG17486 [Bactrocera tryoni]